MTVHDTAQQYQQLPPHPDQAALPGMPVQHDPFAGYVDYFDTSGRTHQFYLPDGKQYIEFAELNEGQRIKYEGKTSRDVKFSRSTDEAAIKINSGEDRKALIMESVSGYHLVRRNKAGGLEFVPWSDRATSPGGDFSQWYEKQNPAIIEDLYKAIREKNGWLQADQTVEMVDAEIKKLHELRAQLVEREANEKNS